MYESSFLDILTLLVCCCSWDTYSMHSTYNVHFVSMWISSVKVTAFIAKLDLTFEKFYLTAVQE